MYVRCYWFDGIELRFTWSKNLERLPHPVRVSIAPPILCRLFCLQACAHASFCWHCSRTCLYLRDRVHFYMDLWCPIVMVIVGDSWSMWLSSTTNQSRKQLLPTASSTLSQILDVIFESSERGHSFSIWVEHWVWEGFEAWLHEPWWYQRVTKTVNGS